MTTVTQTTPDVPKRLRRTYRVSMTGTHWEHLCSACKEWLPADDLHFQRNRNSSTGLGGLCLACNSGIKSKWQRSNPDMAYKQHQRHRARRKDAGGSFTSADWQEMLDRFGHCCVCCGRHESEVGRLEADHMVPAPLGSNDANNRQPLCRPCNAAKSTKRIDYRPLFLSRMMRRAA